MSGRIRLVLALHNHQPIGNFEEVCEHAYRDSYAPFLELLDAYPEIQVCLHNSGSLLEWMLTAHPEYIARLQQFVDRGQIEVLGGPFYEPILACIPRRDRVGQIVAYTDFLKELFGTKVRGMWVPERVWEQSFAGDLARSGMEYTILDDFHFRAAGLRDEAFHSYFVTEDEGRTLKVFPGSEHLRHTIPFQDPQSTIDHLRWISEQHANSVCVFADDGEKFGSWPGTHEHVYGDEWLRRFFDALRENSDWLNVTTLADAVDHISPAGTVYLPDCSYREMTQWALPTENQQELYFLGERKQHDPDWGTLQSYQRGGFWRNFRVKYPESNEMYARMVAVSRRLEDLRLEGARDSHTADALASAERELYRGQCNCPYWHGAFGGLYLPHLRNAIYRHLIVADNLLDEADGKTGEWVDVTSGDFNFDARQEVRLASQELIAWLTPAAGGHIYGLDVRETRHNLLATLNRRPEPYHDLVRQSAGEQQDHDDIAAIHNVARFKQPDLDKKIAYDNWPRKTLVDHFLQPNLPIADFQKGNGEISDFPTGAYQTTLRKSAKRVEAEMTRQGQVGPYAVRVTKTIGLRAESGGVLDVNYVLEDLPAGVPLHFAVEFNFAGLAANATDRYFYNESGVPLGPLDSQLELNECGNLGLIDEWMGLNATLQCSQPADVWTLPIQTISQSEGGFELVHQSTCVVPRWQFMVGEDGKWSVHLLLSLDASTAPAVFTDETVSREIS